MNLTSFFLLGLIFLSLAVIVLIFSKNVEKISQLKENHPGQRTKKIKEKKEKAFLSKVKSKFLFFNKNKGKDVFSKEEEQLPVANETESLKGDQQKNQWANLATIDDITLDKFIDSKREYDSNTIVDKGSLAEDKTVLAEQNSEKRKSFFDNFFRRGQAKRNNLSSKGVELNGEILLSEKEANDDFSEAIISIREKNPNKQKEDKNLIKDVIAVEKRLTFEDDVDLGVDYRILERKILHKVEKNPRDIEVFRQLGELYIKMGEFNDAEEVYKFILKTSPRNSDAKRKLEKIKLLRRLKKRN